MTGEGRREGGRKERGGREEGKGRREGGEKTKLDDNCRSPRVFVRARNTAS